MAGEVVDRCPTGIEGFDRICQGGFVRNSDNLIIGGPGSGKTTFLMQFLWNGITKFEENGLYCSFEPDIIETLNDAMAYGWDFSKYSGEGKIRFMRFAPQTSIEELKSELSKMVSRNNIKRICFDPVSVFALNLNDHGKIRETIFELSSLMKRLKVTTVFADESLEGDWMRLKKGEVYSTGYNDNFFDAVVFNAVLHCLETEEKRKATLVELFRVLKPNGEAIVSVWGKKQARVKNKSKECDVSWTIGGKKYGRYCYLYSIFELEKLLKNVGFEIIKSWEDNNVNFIVRKPS